MSPMPENPKPPAFPTPESRAELLLRQRAGVSVRQLAVEVGASKSTVASAIALAPQRPRLCARHRRHNGAPRCSRTGRNPCCDGDRAAMASAQRPALSRRSDVSRPPRRSPRLLADAIVSASGWAVSEVVYGRVSEALKHALTTRARDRGLSLNATLCELLERGLAENAMEAAREELEAVLAASARELDEKRSVHVSVSGTDGTTAHLGRLRRSSRGR